jgi:hypothetical protein
VSDLAAEIVLPSIQHLAALCRDSRVSGARVRWCGYYCVVVARLTTAGGMLVDARATVATAPRGQMFFHPEDEARIDEQAHGIAAALQDPMLCPLMAEGAWEP